MKAFNKNGFACAAMGLFIGIVNGVLGAGGGILAVPLLKKTGLSQKEAHINAVAVMLTVSLLSAVLYICKGYVNIKDALPYIPAGIAGSVAGTYLLNKISSLWLKRIFGCFIVYAGIRLLVK